MTADPFLDRPEPKVYREHVVCVVCRRVFRGELLNWPWPEDLAERWRIAWHKRQRSDREPCPGRFRFDHRRFDKRRRAT